MTVRGSTLLCWAAVAAAASSTASGERAGRPFSSTTALQRAQYEQEIEDYNACQRAVGSQHRRMLCLPLTPSFDPPPGQQGHGKLQVADKVSIPRELMYSVLDRKPEPPWQFQLRVVRHEEDSEQDEVEGDEGEEGEEGEEPAAPKRPLPRRKERLEQLYCHVLDWQAPRNHVFVPRWMMRTLGIKPRDVVELTWVRLKEGGQVTLRPLTKDFSNWANPQAVMESELKFYSSLTVGSTIAIDYNGARHALHVESVMNGDEQLDGANIYDVNVAVDFTGVPDKANAGKGKSQAGKNKGKKPTAGGGL